MLGRKFVNGLSTDEAAADYNLKRDVSMLTVFTRLQTIMGVRLAVKALQQVRLRLLLILISQPPPAPATTSSTPDATRVRVVLCIPLCLIPTPSLSLSLPLVLCVSALLC